MERLKKVIISKRAELAAKGGHPWIYGTEIEHADEGIEAGDIVRVESKKGKFVGSGFYNPHSKITVRIFSTNANDTFNAAFWKRRAAYAVDYRLQVMRKEDYDCCRLVFGEADQLPGLTVDRFGDVLSVQVLSLGMSGIRRNSWTASSKCCGSGSSRSPASMKEMMSRSVSWRGCSSTRASIAPRCWIRRQRRHGWISWRTASGIRSMWRTGRRRASSLTRNSIVSRQRRSGRGAMSSTASRTRALSH